MEYELRRIPILPLVKVMFFVFLLLGFILGVFYGLMIVSMISVMTSAMDFGDTQVLEQFGSLGFIGIIFMGFFMGIFSAVMSSIFAAIGAACYNLFAGWLGGIKLELHNLELLQSMTRREEPPYTPPTAPHTPQEGGNV